MVVHSLELEGDRRILSSQVSLATQTDPGSNTSLPLNKTMKSIPGAVEMAQWVKALATKSNDQSLIPGMHTVDLQVVL